MPLAQPPSCGVRTYSGLSQVSPGPTRARLPAGETEPVGLPLADVGQNVRTAIVAVAPLLLKQAEPAAQAPIVQPVHHIGAVGIGRGLVDVPAGINRPERRVVAALAALCERP